MSGLDSWNNTPGKLFHRTRSVSPCRSPSCLTPPSSGCSLSARRWFCLANTTGADRNGSAVTCLSVKFSHSPPIIGAEHAFQHTPRSWPNRPRPAISPWRNQTSWPLERILFALAGTMTLLSVLLAATVSPWFLLLTAFVGINQWLYVAIAAMPGLPGIGAIRHLLHMPLVIARTTRRRIQDRDTRRSRRRRCGRPI